MAVSYLEKEANQERAQEIVRNNYSVDDEYKEGHPDALSRPGEPWGKGTNSPWKAPTQPHQSQSKTTYDYAIDTSNGGGSYDIGGINGVGGRDRSESLNLYSDVNEYPGGITIDENIPGQYFVKP